MGLFSQNEIAYLRQQKLGRLATSERTGKPHVIPTGFRLDAERELIKIGGHAHNGQNRLYIRHLRFNPHAAFVVDDLATEPTWMPRGVTIKGLVQIHETGGETLGNGFGPRWIELLPQWVNPWGIDGDAYSSTAPRKRLDVES